MEALDTLVVWKFKGREIKGNTNKKATEKWLAGQRGNFSLHITNVSGKDVGQYTCSVFVATFNKADNAEGFMKLKLYGSSTFIYNVCLELPANPTVAFCHVNLTISVHVTKPRSHTGSLKKSLQGSFLVEQFAT